MKPSFCYLPRGCFILKYVNIRHVAYIMVLAFVLLLLRCIKIAESIIASLSSCHFEKGKQTLSSLVFKGIFCFQCGKSAIINNDMPFTIFSEFMDVVAKS